MEDWLERECNWDVLSSQSCHQRVAEEAVRSSARSSTRRRGGPTSPSLPQRVRKSIIRTPQAGSGHCGTAAILEYRPDPLEKDLP